MDPWVSLAHVYFLFIKPTPIAFLVFLPSIFRAMLKPLLHLQPGLFKAHDAPLHVIPCSLNDMDLGLVDAFLTVADNSGVVGVGVTFTGRGVLKTLALASSDQVLRIAVGKPGGNKKKQQKKKKAKKRACDVLQEKIFTNPALDKLGFDMERVSTALHRDHHLYISPAIDAQSMHGSTHSRHADSVLLGVLGGETTLNKDNVLRVFRDDDSTGDEEEDVVRRAWAAWSISTLPKYAERRPGLKTICTDKIPAAVRTLSRVVTRTLFNWTNKLSGPDHAGQMHSRQRPPAFSQTQ